METLKDILNIDSNSDTLTKLEEVLTEIVASEYNSACAYANIDKVEFDYITSDKPLITLHLRYGVASEDDWQKTIELPYKKDSIDFIAGQFFQAMIDKEW